MDYDPNLTNSGRMAKQTVRLTFALWQYRLTVETVVGGNCTGLTVIDCAVSNVYDKLTFKKAMGEEWATINLPDPSNPEDWLECDDDEGGGEDWLKNMLISAEIISIEPA